MPFVPDNELELAFPANMIPDELKQKLDLHGLHVRGPFMAPHSD